MKITRSSGFVGRWEAMGLISNSCSFCKFCFWLTGFLTGTTSIPARPLAPMDTRLFFTSSVKGVSRDLISTCLKVTSPVGLITQM